MLAPAHPRPLSGDAGNQRGLQHEALAQGRDTLALRRHIPQDWGFFAALPQADAAQAPKLAQPRETKQPQRKGGGAPGLSAGRKRNRRH